MKKIFKSLIIILLSALTVVLISITLILSYKDEIINNFKKYFNQNINTEIRIKGLGINLFKKFPFITINFKDVYVKSNSEFIIYNVLNDTLIYSKNVFVELNLKNLIKRNFIPGRIYLYNSIINIFIDENGKKNYEIFAKSTPNVGSNNLPKNIIIKNSRINFRDLKSKSIIVTDIDKLLVVINIRENRNVILKANGFIINFNSNDLISIYKKNIDLYANISFNDNGKFEILRSKFDIDGIKLNAKGKIEKNIADFHLESQRLNYNLFKNTIRFKNFELIDNYDRIKWNFNLSTSAHISIDENSVTKIKVNFNCNKGIIKSTGNDQIDKITFNGKISLIFGKNLNQNKISLNNLSLEYKGNFIRGNIDYMSSNNNYNLINSDIKFLINADEINQFLNLDNLKLNGEVEGRIKILSEKSLSKIDFFSSIKEAQINFTNFSIKNSKNESYILNKIDEINGDVDLNDYLNFKNLKISYLKNEITINGKLKYPYFNQGELVLKSNYLVLNDLSDLKATSNNKSSNYDLKINLDIQNFVYKTFRASNIFGNIHILNNENNLKIGNFEAFGGKNSLETKIKINESGSDVSGRLILNRINIRNMFMAFNNFGQKSLTYQNIDGTFTGNILFSFFIPENGKVDLKSVNVNSYVEITNGRLRDYPPMMFLSKYIDIEELKDIKFNKLKNNIMIENQKVIIPEMDVTSSAFSLKGSGFHTFNNEYEYNLIIVLNEFLSKKTRKKNKDIENIYEQVENKGTIRIPLKIVGKDTIYKVNIDKTKLLKVNLKKEEVLEDELFMEKNRIEMNSKDKKDNFNENKKIKKIESEKGTSNLKFEWE